MTFQDSFGRLLFALMVRCVIKRRGKFLLVSEKGEEIWETPGGTVEVGADVEHAILREAEEETGYNIRLVRPLTVSLGERHRIKGEKIPLHVGI